MSDIMKAKIVKLFYVLCLSGAIVIFAYYKAVTYSQEWNLLGLMSDSPLPLQVYPESSLKDDWRNVIPNFLYIYSAYYDEIIEPGGAVQVLGMRNRKIPYMQFRCKFKYDNNSEHDKEVIAKLINIGNENENHVLGYRGCTVVCSTRRVPKTCTLMPVHYKGPWEAVPMQVHYKKKYSSGRNNMQVCFAPFYDEYDKVTEIVEFIEMQRLLGVSHFTLYNFSMGGNMSKVVEYYRNMGIATVLPYNLPNPKSIAVRGQHVTIQDCILRSRGYFNYTMLVDPDEYIIPRKHHSVTDLLKTLDNSKTAGFIFPCLYFCKDLKSNKTMEALLQKLHQKYNLQHPLELLTLIKTINSHHVCQFYRHRLNKVIVKPWNVTKATIHYILGTAPGTAGVRVDPYVASLHHYRTCSKGTHKPYDNTCPERKAPFANKLTHRYMGPLITNVIKSLMEIS